jgi:hypothetical protein
MKNTILALAAFICCMSNLYSQVEPRTTLNDYLDAYIGTNAKPYLQPAADLLTTNINTGVWDWSAIHKSFYIKIKANGMLSYPSESMKTFIGHTTGDFTPAQSVEVPTIIGDEESIIIQSPTNEIYVFPGGFDLDKVTLGTPQVTVGGFLNMELSGRFLTFPLGHDEGRVDFYGFGGRYSVTGGMDKPPIDFSVGYFYHHVKAGRYVTSNQHLISAIVGKSGKMLSAHVSIGYQVAMHNLQYMYQDSDIMYNVNLDMENSNPYIVEGGVGLRAGPIMVNGAISYAGFYTFALGVGLIFNSYRSEDED